MIRGISRQIIEVQDTENIYYERAYLVVKPEYANAERAILEREARKILRKMDAPSGMKKEKQISYWLLRVVLPIAATATAVLGISFFI